MITRSQKCGFSRAHYGLKLCAAILTANLCIYTSTHGQLPAFVRGVDLSFLPQLEAQGVVFRANGEAGELLEMLGSNGVNCVRLRLWHSPENGWSNLSNTIDKSDWKNSVFITSVADIRKIKNSNGPDLQVWGSGNLIQLLLKNDLVDELRLKIHPLTLGNGKKLFDNGTIPAAFTLTESLITPGGVIIAAYRRAGKVKTGTVGA